MSNFYTRHTANVSKINLFFNSLSALFVFLLLAGSNVGFGQIIQNITTPGAGTWTVPAGTSGSITVEAWGAGGSGGGASGKDRGASGGTGGTYVIRTYPAGSYTPGVTTYNLFVADQTTGGAAGSNGNNGAATWFESSLVVNAPGGKAGNRATTAAGNGALVTALSTGAVPAAGAVYALGTSAGTNSGSSAGSAGANGGGAGGNGVSAGNNAGVNGNAGTIIGGGGSGGHVGGGSCGCNATGGNGARGQIRITYFVSPIITSFSPSTYCSAGGEIVTITGTNFTGATSVTFNGTPAASFTVNSATQITATTPAGISAGVITVTTSGGSGNSAAYTVVANPAATIASGAGTFCTSTTVTASGGAGGTIYWQGTTSNGTSTATASTSQIVTVSGTYYFRSFNGTCWGDQGSVTVTINSAPAITTQPVNQTVTSIQTATFTVTATGLGLSYQWQEFNGSWSNIANGGVYSGATTATLTITNPPVSMNGRQYRVIVTGTCPPSATSNGSATLFVTNNYCASNATSTADSRINRVQFNTIDQTSPATCQTYTNYTAVSTDVFRGETYQLTITKGTCGTTNYAGFFGAWIDWNNDGDFDDAGEHVLINTVQQAANVLIAQVNVTIPLGAVLGATRMRCIFREGTAAPTPCGTYTWGETEDYTVNILTSLPPTISSISPTAFCSTGGQSVTITGTNFINVTSVTFNGSPAASFAVNSSTQITATTPVGITAGVVTVTTSTGSANSSAYTIVSPAPLSAVSAGPNQTLAPCVTSTTLAGSPLSAGETGTWTVITGSATIISPNNPNSTATVSLPAAPGTLTTTLRWTVTNGCETAFSEVNIETSRGPGCPLPTDYCTPSTLSCGAGDRITRVRIGTLDNNSGTTCTGGYSDYTTTVAAPDLIIGETYSFTLNVGPGSGSHSALVWFDFNGDGDFADAGEGFVIGDLTINPNTEHTISVQIPTNAIIGVTRMRVRYYFNTGALTSTSCISNASFGETEDYVVNLVCGTTPSDVTHKFPADGFPMTCGANATLSWRPHTCATGYKVLLGTTNPPTEEVSNQTTTSFITGNLESNTTYFWSVIPYGPGGDGASSVMSFTTDVAIAASTAPSQSVCGTGNNVTLTASGAASGWQYFWYDDPALTDIVFTGTPYVINNVMNEQTYYVTSSFLGAPTDLATVTGGGVTCGTTGFGSMFDVVAKTSNVIVTQVSGRFRLTGSQTVKLYYKTGSYVGFGNTPGAWTLAGTATVNVTSTTVPTIVNFPDIQIPAGQVYGFYFVYDQVYSSFSGVYANADIEIRTGSSICNTGEFGTEITDRTFNGRVYYTTNCASPATTVVVTPLTAENSVILVTNTEVSGAVEQCTLGAWTYYAHPSTPNEWVFAIDKNGNTFTATVDIKDVADVYESIVDNTPTNAHGSFLMSRYWNVNLTSGSINSANPVRVRFFHEPAEITASTTRRDAELAIYQPITTENLVPTNFRWIKNNTGVFNEALIASINGYDFGFPLTTLTQVATGTISGVTFVDLGGITSFSGGTGVSGFIPEGSPLPVTLTQFNANCVDDETLITWTTASEYNASHFALQYSRDGFTWINVAEIEAAGTTSLTSNYSFNHKNFGGLSYYRLVQVDFDGTSEVYGPISVNCEIDANNMIVYPNPTNQDFTVLIQAKEAFENAVVELIDLSGRLVQVNELNIMPGTSTIKFETFNINPGTYIVRIKGQNDKFAPIRVVVM